MEGAKNKICRVKNENGPVLAYSEDSGVSILEKDGLKFKDLAKDGELHPYEDWRKSAKERAEDLAGRLTIEQIAGLMLYSKHQYIPGFSDPHFGEVTYHGKQFKESGSPVWELSDQQKEFLEEDFVRHVLLVSVPGTADAVRWSNELQAMAEKLPLGIPVNVCSDPRHGIDSSTEFNMGAGGGTSQWPESIGMAATFDPELVKGFGKIASKEYRAIGLTTALSPQCDLSTEPRWFRFPGTFGEGAELAADMTRAYCDGFQTSEGDRETEDGWGYDSVNAMVKHWPGGGCGEGGRDAHFGCGKYAVYPGDNFSYHLKPFVEGAFALEGKTKKASSVMPYYVIPYGQDPVNGENVGCSYSDFLIKDMLRGTYGYDEVVCTDWNIVFDEGELDRLISGKCWGVEHLSIGERCLKVIMAGVDQFGGLSDKEPVMAAYQLGVEKYGEGPMRQRMEQSAVRILKNIFRTGLFEDPYLDAGESMQVVGCECFVKAGYEAQKRSLVLLKNKNKVLPLKEGCKLYIPKRFVPAMTDWVGNSTPQRWEYPMGHKTLQKSFTVVDDPAEADAAVCFVEAPCLRETVRGYDREDLAGGGNGYVPISLQYRPYTAQYARKASIAGGDPLESFTDRSYAGKTVYTKNEADLDMILDTKKAMGDKPVIVSLYAGGPAVVSEFEPYVDALIYNFNDTAEPIRELLAGHFEPSGLLPLQIPKDMKAVEEQKEDMPFDMECHVDSEGNCYDYAFGLDWGGVIKDERVERYGNKKI